MSTPNRMHMPNSFDAAGAAALPPATQALLRRRESVLGAPYRLFYEQPAEFVRGEGAHLIDADGHDHLDAYNNVPVVGHANPRVRAAVDRQLGALTSHTRYLSEPVIAYAERLTALFPAPLDRVVFACSGSEAVDLALRVARHVTGAEGVIALRGAYHGTTRAAAEVSPSLGANNAIPPFVELIDAPDSVREQGGAAAAALAERVTRGIQALQARGVRFAGLIADTVFSSNGLQLGSGDGHLLTPTAEVVRAAGGVLIADEVQAGFGRTGDTWWGFQRDGGFAPDLVVLGKPMGNGLPISAVVGREPLFTAFGSEVRYFSTFGGTQVSIAAADAVLDELEQRALLPHAAELGGRLRAAMSELIRDDEGVAEVRGAGLFLAVEFVSDRETRAPDAARATRVVNELRRRHILTSVSGTFENVLKIRPPLVVDAADAERLLEGLQGALACT